MTLIRFEPLRELDSFTNQIERYFNDFSSSFERRAISPSVDVYENENNLVVEIEAPGIKKEDMKITLEDNILTVAGEKKRNLNEDENIKCFRAERTFGSFKRSFTLPADVDPDKTKAKFENGVLEITLEKIDVTKTKEKSIELK
mgnify:CR=1 FL=1